MQAAAKLPQRPEHAAWTDYLREVSLFSDISEQPEALRFLVELMAERSFKPGEDILREGETGTDMFFLLQGEAGVFKSTLEGDQYKVFILKAANHAFFGEGGMLDSDARSATIRAETTCRCLVLGSDAFQKFSKQHPEWALPVLARIAQAVMARLRKTNHDLTLLYNALVSEIRGG